MPSTPSLRAALVFFICSVSLAIVSTGIFFVWLGSRGGMPPLAAVQGEQWTHREMLEYLTRKGVKHRAIASEQGGGLTPHRVYIQVDFGDDIREVATIELYSSSRQAREAAGSGGCVHWGRFVLEGDDRAWRAVARALGVRAP